VPLRCDGANAGDVGSTSVAAPVGPAVWTDHRPGCPHRAKSHSLPPPIPPEKPLPEPGRSVSSQPNARSNVRRSKSRPVGGSSKASCNRIREDVNKFGEGSTTSPWPSSAGTRAPREFGRAASHSQRADRVRNARHPQFVVKTCSMMFCLYPFTFISPAPSPASAYRRRVNLRAPPVASRRHETACSSLSLQSIQHLAHGAHFSP